MEVSAVWGCKLLKPFRIACGVVAGLAGFDQLSFLDFMELSRVQLVLEELELLCMVLWSKSFLGEFQAAASSPNTAASQDKQARCWFPPVLGYWKINTEFALDVTKGAVGVRIIIRNHLGLVCASAAQKLVANFSPMVAEAVALLLGISFAVNSGLCPASL
ncbi:hypothetical protein ACOSQ4_003894 [Xanthoceras sorbifolium]